MYIFDFHAGGAAWTAPADALPPKLSAKLKADGDSALNPAVKQQLFMWNWRVSLDRARPRNSSKRWKTFSEKTTSGVPCLSCKTQRIPSFSE